MFSIYCVKPISGEKPEDVFSYYERIKEKLSTIGYNVLLPLYGKGKLRTDIEFKAHGYKDCPLTSNHAIFSRDKFFVHQSDILFVNLLGAKNISIGSISEMMMGHVWNKQIVTLMEPDNVHMHAFVIEASTIVFTEEEESLKYLEDIYQQKF